MCQGLIQDGWKLPLPMPGLDDPEGDRTPPGLTVWDTHVHLFPPRVYEAIWRWFETNAWPIRYKLYAEETLAHLTSRGVERAVGLLYSHVPEMARSLNHFMAEFAAQHPQVIPFGTVLPGEPDAEAIVAEALEDLQLRGLKLHCHVQQFAPDDPRLDPVYAHCARLDRIVLIHAGREPSLPAYKGDIHALCAAERMARVLDRHPTLRVIVPHLGADEIPAYGELLARYPNLYLDTTMMLAEYFPQRPAREFLEHHADRILYGSDFPNVPYAWDRELKHLADMGLSAGALAAITHGNARKLFGDGATRP